MAIYDSQTQNKSTRNSRNFRDIDLDFARNPVTNDVNVVEDVIAVKRSVRNLVQTNFYERPFQPEIGSDVSSLLVDNIEVDLNERISDTLSEDIKFWLPYIVIDNIDVQTEPDRNFVKIELRFRVTEQGANQQIIVFYDSAGSTIE